MKLGIMQPYFLPYIGYWQLMNAVDKYVVYDDIEYTKKGWINRNRILQNGNDTYITIPLKKDSDFLNINERFISKAFDKRKLLNKIKENYKKAVYFDDVFPRIESIIYFESNNLFDYLYHSLTSIKNILGIETNLIVSSAIPISHKLKGKDKVLELCKTLEADEYYNAIGGRGLYDKAEFAENGIKLLFLQPTLLPYVQFNNEFVPGLSILDILMFNSITKIKRMLSEFSLI